MNNNFKKNVALILILAMLINLFACNNSPSITKSNIDETTSLNKIAEHQEGKYPIHWNLTQIYKNDDEWEKDFKKFEAYVSTISELQGTINNADSIYKFILLNTEGEMAKIDNKLYGYIHFNKDLNTINPTYLNLKSKLDNLYTKYNKATSFFQEEIKKIPIDKLNAIFEDERLKPYKYHFNAYFLEDRPKYTKETLDAIIQATSNYGGNENVFDVLQYADLKKPKITMPNGEVKDLNETLFDEITYGDYSRELKKEADNLHAGETKDYINTLTALLYNHMKEVYNEVALENGNEVLKYELENKNIDREIYDNIIYATHKLLPELQRYLKLKKEILKYDDLYYIDTLGTYSKYKGEATYDEAVEKVKSALSILGDEYIEKYDEMVNNGHIDVYPDKNKVSGGYESSLTNTKIKPYILLNFTGFISEVKTLAHEMGHAIFDIFSEENANTVFDKSPSIFLHEIASTFNENIFTKYMIDNSNSEEEKLYYVEDIINSINTTLIRQVLYSEFEDFLYKKIENNENFEANELCDKWIELHKEYYGDAMTLQEGTRYRWAAIPHFYYVYYVYKYATSLTYSSILAKEVYEHKDGALEKYIEFLKNGESEKPGNILKKIGIDPNDKKTYDEFFDYYKSLIDEFEKLTKEK